MNADFQRILTLLRKERGISQKQAASEFGISQALLSHYEKGIRECGLDFLTSAADFYGVSCDYLLGRSPERTGTTLTVDDIPEPDAIGKENNSKASLLPVLNKKLIANSLNILYDLLMKTGNKTLIIESSSYLMLAVYRIFRLIASINHKNQSVMYSVSKTAFRDYADAAMKMSEARVAAIAAGDPLGDDSEVKNIDDLIITTELLSQNYPLFASSLLNLISNSENKIEKLASTQK